MVDTHCDDSSRIARMMQDGLGAHKQAFGLRDPETMLELWVDPKNREWTLVQSYSNGTSCIVAMGEHWEEMASAPAQS